MLQAPPHGESGGTCETAIGEVGCSALDGAGLLSTFRLPGSGLGVEPLAVSRRSVSGNEKLQDLHGEAVRNGNSQFLHRWPVGRCSS